MAPLITAQERALRGLFGSFSLVKKKLLKGFFVGDRVLPRTVQRSSTGASPKDLFISKSVLCQSLLWQSKLVQVENIEEEFGWVGVCVRVYVFVSKGEEIGWVGVCMCVCVKPLAVRWMVM